MDKDDFDDAKTMPRLSASQILKKAICMPRRLPHTAVKPNQYKKSDKSKDRLRSVM